jgi:arylsulfatase A-like enzyme
MEVDAVPFLIYHKDVEPQSIDVQGRTSVDLAPTLLDYLDVSVENYFVGTSLFAPVTQASAMETFFSDGGNSEFSTKGGTVSRLSPAAQRIAKTFLRKYYAAKQQEPLIPDGTVTPSDPTVWDESEAPYGPVASGEIQVSRPGNLVEDLGMVPVLPPND